VSQDRIDYSNLPEHEKHIFISNLKYQTLLDSIQGRSPNVALLPMVSIPELETWIETWSFSETIHSRSYTHIIRNIVNEPATVFDDIVTNEYIIRRAEEIAQYYDDLIKATQHYHLFGEGRAPSRRQNHQRVFARTQAQALPLPDVRECLEAIRFYVSFACSFAFAERELMEGNAKIIKLIARDEACI
jgi:ribonucleoside-diphosphate reductase beta chain